MSARASYRSMLFVPGHKPDWVPKALRVQPDAIILDLEDAVPVSSKGDARDALAGMVQAARDGSEGGGTQVSGKASGAPPLGVVVRPNAWVTDHAPADLEAAVAAGADALLVPKVDSAHELVRLDAILSFLERRRGIADQTTGVIASLESAAGLVAAAAIAAAPRVIGCLAAAAKDADTARSIGFRWSAEGRETLAWRTSALLACRAAGVHPIVGLWQDVHDLEGLAAFADANRAIGFGGQVVIHPSHVGPVNAAYAPSDAEVRYYEGLLEAAEAAEHAGSGAVVYDGDHVDAAHVATARAVVEQAHARASRGQPS